MVWYGYYPWRVTVYMGTGAVWENPTLGLPVLNPIKVYSQTSLPSGLNNWKTVICNLDHLHQGFAKVKQSICPFWPNVTQMQTLATAPILDTLYLWTLTRADPNPKCAPAIIVEKRAT